MTIDSCQHSCFHTQIGIWSPVRVRAPWRPAQGPQMHIHANPGEQIYEPPAQSRDHQRELCGLQLVHYQDALTALAPFKAHWTL